MAKTNFDRYIEEEIRKHPSLKKELEKADRAWDIALQLIALREKRGFTQKRLAHLAGTSQSNIARLESADYRGYSLKTLEKVAKILKARVDITFVPVERKPVKPELKPAFL
jgi:transcriptional regulator with XRE-family HTH domain